MNAGTAPQGANPKVRVAPLSEIRRRAKRVQAKAGALAREVAQLEELCQEHGIKFELVTRDDAE